MDKCKECFNRRMVISENGYHFICSLSSIASHNCIFGKKDHFIQRPKSKVVQQIIGEIDEHNTKT